MKNIYKLFFTIMIIGTLSSCDDTVDPVIYNGDISNRTFLSFARSTYNFPVDVDSQSTLDITLNSSTRSESDRTFNILLNVEDSNANESIYTLPSVVTIPANSYQGVLTVIATDNDDLDGNQQTIKFSLTDLGSNIDMDSNEVTVNMFEVCPVPETFFTGMYLIEQITPEVDGPTLSTGTIVEVTLNEEDTSGLSRTFLTENYPQYCSGTFAPFTISLVCNELVVPDQNNLCNCGDGTNWFGTSTGSNGTYSVDLGDDVLEVSFLDDQFADCAPVTTTTYRFTKQ